MAQESSRLIVERGDEEIVQVRFLDRNILEEAVIQDIGDELTDLVNRNDAPKLLLDFDGVEHLSSAALGTLIKVNNHLRSKEGQLRLCRINPQIYEVFAITKLNKLFQIHDDVDAALSSFK